MIFEVFLMVECDEFHLAWNVPQVLVQFSVEPWRFNSFNNCRSIHAFPHDNCNATNSAGSGHYLSNFHRTINVYPKSFHYSTARKLDHLDFDLI
jgi:hypothetical protein